MLHLGLQLFNVLLPLALQLLHLSFQLPDLLLALSLQILHLGCQLLELLLIFCLLLGTNCLYLTLLHSSQTSSAWPDIHCRETAQRRLIVSQLPKNADHNLHGDAIYR